MTFVEAAMKVLRENNNEPMSSQDIWNKIESIGLVKTGGKTPAATLNTILLSNSDNSNLKTKSKRNIFTIKSKNPIKFSLIEEISVEEDFDLSDKEIIENFNKLVNATIEIRSCIEDSNFLCKTLNQIDRNFLHKYYNSPKSGVVIDIRKEIAKEVLLGTVDNEKLTYILNQHRDKNSQAMKSFANPYAILHPLVNHKFVDLDIFMEKFVKYLLTMFGEEVKYTISDFNGSRNQGSSSYWFAFYNKSMKSQSDSLQLYLSFSNGSLTYGLYNFFESKYLERKVFENDLNQIYDFIKVNSTIILSDTENSIERLSKDIKKKLEENDEGLTVKDIIQSLDINVTELTIKKIMEEMKDVEIVYDKFKVKDRLPGTNKLKKYLMEQGFVTIEKLMEILDKNGLKI